MKKLSLTGTWKLSGNNYCCDAVIPGDFHSALLEAGIIENPYYGFNEQKSLWVGKTDWTIERTFTLNKLEGAKSIIELTMADTFFTLFINGKEAGKGENAFARHRFDITDLVNNGENTISLVFESAEKHANEIAKNLPYPIPTMAYDVSSPNRNLVRKAQCHGGWDWGPCLMVSGIYDDIFIEQVYSGLFDNVMIKYSHKDSDWTAHVTVNFDSFVSETKNFTATISGTDIEKSSITQSVKLQSGKNTFVIDVPVKNPSVWKTNGELKEDGLSENIIYDLDVSFKDKKAGVKSENKKICFSTLRVVSEKDTVDGKPGRSLYFENNGRAIFAKGSNWIPADALPSRMTEQRYYDLIKSAADANHNCIRIWGGGFYEKEIFYDLCDRFGIIIWHDCMFACSTYPATKWFFELVSQEIEYQIPRIQTHASIGIWCGNNENYGALNWFPETKENHDRYLADYDRLYNGLIGKRIKEIDPARQYWPSSPCAGPDDYADNWHNDSFGDMHYWSVWHEKKGWEAYLSIRPRFVSEFGYESFPSMNCIKSFAEEEQYNFTSALMEYHQRSPSGNSIILENFSRYFRFPNGFENMVYLSQVQQAVAIRTAIDWWRSLKPHCTGSIYWQLNDVWPGPSWSSLEYDGKWKLLHYESKKFFSNIYLPLFVKDDVIHAVVSNDTTKALKGTVKIHFIKYDGTEFQKTEIIPVDNKADEAKEVFSKAVDKENSKDYFVYAELISDSGELISVNTTFPAKYKHSNYAIPKIECTVESAGNDFMITLKTDKPAFFVALDITDIPGRFSNNMITLLPGYDEKILFTPKKKTSLSVFKKKLVVKNITDTYK